MPGPRFSPAAARAVLFEDPFVREAMARLERVTVAQVGIGARRKHEAILGALRGRWVNVLVMDRVTAERLMA